MDAAPSQLPSRTRGSTRGRRPARDLADDVRGPAELAEWERIEQLLTAAPPGTLYDPDADPIVRAEL
ncbi:hypothetical protein E4N64_34775, partial [Streptomyces sp. MNU103]|nr:hypothetical protein [Streptomyces sp. MNU103]